MPAKLRFAALLKKYLNRLFRLKKKNKMPKLKRKQQPEQPLQPLAIRKFRLEVIFEVNKFRRELKGLLSPLVESRSHLDALLHDVHSIAWLDPQLREDLEKHLGCGQYEFFVRTIQTFRDILKALNIRLGNTDDRFVMQRLEVKVDLQEFARILTLEDRSSTVGYLQLCNNMLHDTLECAKGRGEPVQSRALSSGQVVWHNANVGTGAPRPEMSIEFPAQAP